MAPDTAAIGLALDSAAPSPGEEPRTRTLGNVRLRHHETNDIILVPTPSTDPNDPLNWCVWS